MSHDEFLIKGAGLQKTFKDFWGRPKVKAIQNIDITVPKGSIFGLLGPNGAGKSTLLKIILGHLYPTAGRIQVLGKDPRDVSIKQKMGYLPERSYLYKNLTATETLHYFGEILGLDKKQIKSRTEQLLEMVGLKNAIHRQVGQFSHGMTRRMGLAQALLNDPELLILDEPTAGLDPLGCREVKDLIITLGQRGKTVLLTSHLLADVEDVADDLLVIYGGTVQSGGKANQLLQDQDKTRLEFPNVSQATMQKALASLKSELPSSSINITSPNQSLEDYFINIVQKSTAKGSANSGAAAGSGVADYLKEETIVNDEFSILNETTEVQTPQKEQEIEPQISQIDTDEKTILNEKQKETGQQSVYKSSGNAVGSSATNSKLESPGSTEFHSASTADINKKEVEPQNTQKNTEVRNRNQEAGSERDLSEAQAKRSATQAKRIPSEAQAEASSKDSNETETPKPGNADGSSATNSDTHTTDNCQLEPDTSPSNPSEAHPKPSASQAKRDLSEAQTEVANSDSTTNNSKFKIQNSKLSEPIQDANNTNAQTKLPPVPKLGLSENEAKSIRLAKINKVIHRS